MKKNFDLICGLITLAMAAVFGAGAMLDSRIHAGAVFTLLILVSAFNLIGVAGRLNRERLYR